jgi:hypothetical protein
MSSAENKPFPEFRPDLDYFLFALFRTGIVQFNMTIDQALVYINSLLFTQDRKEKAEKIANYLRKTLAP